MPIAPTLSPERYAIERAICDKAHETMRANWPGYARGGAIPDAVTSHPDWQACDNEMRGRVEQYELLTAPPETIFAYMGEPDARACNYESAQPWPVTAWTGHRLGTAFARAKWKTPGSFVSSHMYQFSARIAGRDYTGRGPGAGMYVRLRETAKSKRARNAAPEVTA
jgi:hypothetical protein